MYSLKSILKTTIINYLLFPVKSSLFPVPDLLPDFLIPNSGYLLLARSATSMMVIGIN